jgi:endonuclease YncB( thermonuclease family)
MKASIAHFALPMTLSACASILLCFDGLAFGAEFGADFPGHLVALLDGDKVDISYHDTNESVPLRLYGIDAPEQGQPHWQEATDFLRKLLDG